MSNYNSQFLLELVEEALDAAFDYGAHSTGKDGVVTSEMDVHALNYQKASEKLYKAISIMQGANK